MKNTKVLDERLRKTGMKFLFGEQLCARHLRMAKIGFSVFLAGLGFSVQKIFMIPLAVLGYYLPEILMEISNDADNAEMLEDIRSLYDTLRIQAKAGVFLTQSFMDCYLIVKHPRMKAALLEFNNQMLAKSSFSEAISKLEQQFDNPYIDALCLVLKQSMESGRSVQILTDLSSQMTDVEHALRLKQKEKLDRQIQLLQLLLFVGMLGICIYGMAVEVMDTVIHF
ncbi:MAG: hypothetical protein ACI4DV_04015 [Lachnospiraceae bacterium]